jgi:hypothetical protein
MNKTKTTILTLIAISVSAHADLIDTTPGGWYYADHGSSPPPAVLTILGLEAQNRLAFADEYRSDGGWVSLYGVLNGGTYFNVIGGLGDTASVSWDFSSLNNFAMRWIDVFGFNNGDPWEAVYQVTGGTTLTSPHPFLLTLNDNIDITSISFYITDPNTIPDGGHTALLFGAVLLALTFMRRLIWM